MYMGRRPQSLAACINGFVKYLESNPGYYSPRTVVHYRDGCNTIFNRLLVLYDDEVLPYTVTKQHVDWLIAEMQRRHYAIKTRKIYLNILRQICKYYNNNVFDKVKYRFPSDMRPHVDWLTEDQARRLLEMPKDIRQELVVHLELCLGLRRVEVVRLRVQDIRDGYLNVLGKGAAGGKPRSVPFHRDTKDLLDRFLQYRDALIEQFRLDHPRMQQIIVPDSLLIWKSRNSLNPYAEKGTGIDKMLMQLGKELGVKFTSHTLRRTFGRLLYRADPNSFHVISKIYGHENGEVTYRYLGLDMDDMTGAMAAFPL